LSEVIIRRANKTDYNEVKKLVKQLYEDLEVTDGMEKELDQDKFNTFLKDPEILIYIADLDGKAIGYLTMNFNRALLDIGTTAIIDELVVDQDHRGGGVGTKLVAHAVTVAKELGCSEIGVGTESENKSARKFYKKCGFDEIGVIFEKHLVKH
jgi:GNAT superfamily N-acetyltransferase